MGKKRKNDTMCWEGGSQGCSLVAKANRCLKTARINTCTTTVQPLSSQVEAACLTPVLSSVTAQQIVKPQAKEITMRLRTLHMTRSKLFLRKTLLVTQSKALRLMSAWCNRSLGYCTLQSGWSFTAFTCTQHIQVLCRIGSLEGNSANMALEGWNWSFPIGSCFPGNFGQKFLFPFPYKLLKRCTCITLCVLFQPSRLVYQTHSLHVVARVLASLRVASAGGYLGL